VHSDIRSVAQEGIRTGALVAAFKRSIQTNGEVHIVLAKGRRN
jgi:hypothetical protein